MTQAPRPRDVIERYLRPRRWADLPALYAEDALVEHPLDPHAASQHGRAALRAHFAHLQALGLHMTATDAMFHEAGDTVVADPPSTCARTSTRPGTTTVCSELQSAVRAGTPGPAFCMWSPCISTHPGRWV